MNSADTQDSITRVLFVCLGNICRSPTAHGVFQGLVEQRNLQAHIQVDSSGTGDWHIGQPPDMRATQEASNRGYDLSELRARQVTAEDFLRFDYILAMDKANLEDLQAIRPAGSKAKPSLFLDYSQNDREREVPDPYHGGEEGFARVFDMIERASEGLLQEINSARLTP